MNRIQSMDFNIMHRGLRGYEEMERLYNSEILVLSDQQEILELLIY